MSKPLTLILILLFLAAPSSAFAYKQSCAQACVKRCSMNPGKSLCASKCNANCERARAGTPGWQSYHHGRGL
jgi:hypothetical protein